MIHNKEAFQAELQLVAERRDQMLEKILFDTLQEMNALPEGFDKESKEDKQAFAKSHLLVIEDTTRGEFTKYVATFFLKDTMEEIVSTSLITNLIGMKYKIISTRPISYLIPLTSVGLKGQDKIHTFEYKYHNA